MSQKFLMPDPLMNETEEALRRSEERFQRLIDTSHEGIWEVDREGHTVFSNHRLTEMLGYTGEEFRGLTPFKLIHPEDSDRFTASWQSRLRGESNTGEWRLRRKDGHYHWVSASGSPIRGDRGQVVGALAMISDVSAKKLADDEVRRLNTELEQRVQERTSQLEATNKELEAFCYSISHDLRAPLRTIRGFTEVLMEQYGEQIDDRGRDFLRRTCEASAQMDRLIDDLLKLSRVSRAGIQNAEINLSTMVEQIFSELKRAEPDRAVGVVVTPRLTAHGDERLMRLVLDNLLRNAWKFTGKNPEARIEFGRMEEGEAAFFVRDNGAGFDMAYSGKLFGVFQRLHSSSEFPGSGVGLAIVQRVINRHGGKIWAEGKVNEGATFYFTLPVANT
jgi:PAS domain S-box-containing protein